MIRHICMFKLKEENKDSNIDEFIKRAGSLRNLSMVKRFEVVRNAPAAPAANYEVSLIFDFDSIDELNNYQVAPEHVKFAEFVGNIRETRACIDYEI